jgi:hypothetical protein
MVPNNIVLNPIEDFIRISNIVRKILDFDIDLDIFNLFKKKKPRNLATIIRDRRNAAYWKVQNGGNKTKKNLKKNNKFRKTRNK